MSFNTMSLYYIQVNVVLVSVVMVDVVAPFWFQFGFSIFCDKKECKKITIVNYDHSKKHACFDNWNLLATTVVYDRKK